MSFMMRIEAAQKSPLDQLAIDYHHVSKVPSPPLSFCQQLTGVPEGDELVAKRLGAAVQQVRGWRELGRRSSRGSCE